ncbi:ferrous iron transport protein B [Halorhabdus salina]|uniref:ferrous iron transport protein B n=1 Tax=Halorhabdus salina TaxID=2750670 RepID=UPI0015EEB1AA|nr:ferrous iron transport protein B [Halorhabdus salina]
MSVPSRVLLMRHPNVGKSALFNRLAGTSITESNYPGTTVDYTESELVRSDGSVPIVDVPGTFSLSPSDRAEAVAVEMLEDSPAATVVCVLDATQIERGLNLAVEILERDRDVIVALNMFDEARREGVDIDVDRLSELLGVPVVPTIAVDGTGIDALQARLDDARNPSVQRILERVADEGPDGGESEPSIAVADPSPPVDERTPADGETGGDDRTPDEDGENALGTGQRWNLVDAIVARTVSYRETDASLSDQIGRLAVSPRTGIPFAVAVLYGVWTVFSAVAGFFTDGYFVPLFDDYWLPWLQSAFPMEGSWLYFLVVGDPTATNSFEAFGVLTSGLFVAIGVVLPAILTLYAILAVLEDSGYMARLAVLLDAAFRRIGLDGFAIVPMVLSFGCNVPGVAATRSLETEKQRFLTMTLLSVFIPCGAQLGVMLSLIPQYTGYILLYLLAGFFVFGAVLNRLVPGSAPDIVIDIPPMRQPRVANVTTKLSVRVRGFVTTAIPFVLLGVAVVNVLYLGGAVEWLANTFRPVLSGWFGVPGETVPALIAGFMRKDLAVAQLSAVSMTPFQTITSVVMVSLYFPCVATFAMLIKEGRESGGVLKVLGGALATLLAALFVWGGLLRLIGIALGVA